MRALKRTRSRRHAAAAADQARRFHSAQRREKSSRAAEARRGDGGRRRRDQPETERPRREKSYGLYSFSFECACASAFVLSTICNNNFHVPSVFRGRTLRCASDRLMRLCSCRMRVHSTHNTKNHAHAHKRTRNANATLTWSFFPILCAQDFVDRSLSLLLSPVRDKFTVVVFVLRARRRRPAAPARHTQTHTTHKHTQSKGSRSRTLSLSQGLSLSPSDRSTANACRVRARFSLCRPKIYINRVLAPDCMSVCVRVSREFCVQSRSCPQSAQSNADETIPRSVVQSVEYTKIKTNCKRTLGVLFRQPKDYTNQPCRETRSPRPPSEQHKDYSSCRPTQRKQRQRSKNHSLGLYNCSTI